MISRRLRTGTLWAGLACLIGLGLLAVGCRARSKPAAPPLPDLMDQTRSLWSPPGVPFLRHWLLCGDFPHPPGSGLELDYLRQEGGEASVQPVAGMKVERPDGTEAVWTDVNSPGDVVNLLTAFPGRPTTNVVAYGYTVLDWPRTEKALLSVGSDDGVKVWVNGKVALDHDVARGLTRDEDQVEVPLQSGRNTILVKVEQGGGDWGFCVRMLSRADVLLMPRHGLSISTAPADPALPLQLVVKIAPTAPATGVAEIPAAVDVVAAGGKIVASRRTMTGAQIVFNTTPWPDGAYDIRCTATPPGGRTQYAYTLWYNGDALAEAEELVDSADGADPNTQVGMTHAMLADLVTDRLGEDLTLADPNKLPSVYSALMEWEELQMPGGRGGVRPNGFIRLAYRSQVDNSPQFCRAYLPPNYSPNRRWPMVVHLHGYNASNPPYVRWGIDGRHHGWADNYGVIALEPLGRYNTTFWGIGEKDVVRCVEMAEKQLSVDPNRVYLVGESMGGGGTWYVGSRHPGLFAAIAPSFGGHDYHADMTSAEVARVSPHDLYRLEARSMYVQAESLLTTPVFVNHGDRDDLVKIGYSRYAVKLLQRWGYNIRYWEHPGYGHGGWDADDEIFHWLLSIRRVAHPDHVRLRAADVSTASSHWVRIEQCLDPWKLMNVDASVVAPNVIRLDTDNVARITLSPGRPLIDPKKPVQVVWNNVLRTVDLSRGHVTLDAAGYVAPPDGKTPRRWGRMDDVFRTPFAIVVGTTSTNPMMRRMVQREADRFVTWWQQWQHVTPRLFRDVDLTKADADRYSLVLVGGPAENAVSYRMQDKIPIKVLPGGFIIDGHPFPVVDGVAQVVYRHPTNPNRYVAIIAATSPAGMFYADRLPGDLDFAIIDGRMPRDQDPPPSARIVGGMFDNGWRYSESYIELGDPDVRKECPVRRAPALISADVPGKRLMLGDVLESAAEGTFLAMTHDQNWQGEPLTLRGHRYSSGIAAQPSADPCSVTYDLTGDGWNRLRATIGLEVDARSLSSLEKANTLVQYVVSGDGIELYRSPMLHWNSAPLKIDVDVKDVKMLMLSIREGSTFHNAARSVDWADLRLER